MSSICRSVQYYRALTMVMAWTPCEPLTKGKEEQSYTPPMTAEKLTSASSTIAVYVDAFAIERFAARVRHWRALASVQQMRSKSDRNTRACGRHAAFELQHEERWNAQWLVSKIVTRPAF